MYLPSYMASQLASERRREMLAQAEQHRARKLAAVARASRQAERAEHRMRRAVRKVMRLRAGLQQ